MSPALRAAVVALPETAWTGYKAPGEALDTERDWAEVPFVPSEPSEHKDRTPLRYLGIRIRPRKARCLLTAEETYFAVVTSRQDVEGAKLLQGHRQKAGTIEQVHDRVKNDLGGGVLPSKYFGANAAWMRLALLA